jgi:hypothetical protein
MEGSTRGGLDARVPTRPEHLTSAVEPIGASEMSTSENVTILGTRAKLFRRYRTSRTPRAHRSDGQRQSMRLRHLLCALQTLVARRCKVRVFRKVYC